MSLVRLFAVVLGSSILCASSVWAQSPYPDLLYFKFDEGGGFATANLAVPGVGYANAPINGLVLAPSGGQFGGALTAVVSPISVNTVDTGWVTSLPGDFTLGFWLDLTSVALSTPQTRLCGDFTADGLVCVANGAAGPGGIVLKSATMPGTIIPGGAVPTAPHHVAWVYIASTRELRGYLDGAFTGSSIQPAHALTGQGHFRIGGDAQIAAIYPGTRIDEFRLYGRALSDLELAATWNVSLTNTPSTFCTAGTTSNGCVPSISASGTPSASASSGFTISVSTVEGLKQGLIFYGVDNSNFTPLPWGPSSSFLCVKPPTQRTLPQSSGGTLAQCNGSLSVDWNAFRAANPAALGAPFMPGQPVFAQAWFRDPPSPKTTNLSDALQFTLGP